MDDLFNKALAQAGISDLAGQNAQSGRIAQNIQKDHPAIPSDPSEIFKDVGVTEYVGTAIGPTIGLILPGMDPALARVMGLGDYRAIGFIGSRVGFAPHAFALDEAVKSTNTEVLKAESPRDGIGGCGTSAYFIIGGANVADTRRCVEMTLSLMSKYYGGIWINDYGHLDMQWSPRASQCLQLSFGAEPGEAVGLINGGPAPVGAVLADVAVKAAEVEIVNYTSCANGLDFAYGNEVTTTITGDSEAVRQAVRATIDPGRKILSGLGSEAECMGTPYY